MVTFSIQEQKQFYEQIQKDKEDNDSTFLDVARVAVEKELQTTKEQPDQHKVDDQHQQNDDQDTDQAQQNNDQDHQGHQSNDQDYQGQQDNDQDSQDQQPNGTQDIDQGHNQQNNDQQQQLVEQSQSQQDINDQANTDEQTGKTSTAEVGNQDDTSTDKQIITSQSEVPIQTTDTPPDATTTEKSNTDTDTAVTVQHKEPEDMQKQKDEVTDVSSTQNIVVTEKDTGTTKPEPATQDTTLQEPIQNDIQDTNSLQTLLQDDINTAKAATESEKTDAIAKLSVANLAAHNIANPPLIERTDTLQTLTTVTMLDNPIRLEQLSRSSLDTDHSKKHRHQQIVQTVSTMAVNGDGKQNDDVIAITGTVDTGAMKSSISSSTLSNVTDLTE